jgi:hypothetical protein
VDPRLRIYDISAHLGSDARIRFLTSPDMGLNDAVFFDDVEICVRN